MSDVELRPARPTSMLVARRGTPLPPDSQYFVLDLVYDFQARVAVARLGRYYTDTGQQVRAAECWNALDESKDAHQAYCLRRYPSSRRRGKVSSS